MRETPQEIIFEGCRVYAIAPEDYDAMVRELARLRVELANELRRRKAAEDDRDQHEVEWSAALTTAAGRVG